MYEFRIRNIHTYIHNIHKKTGFDTYIRIRFNMEFLFGGLRIKVTVASAKLVKHIHT